MSTVFLKILDMSITAIWLIAAVIVLRLIINRVSKRLSCIMWLLVGLRLTIPFSFKSSISIVPNTQALPYKIIRADNYTVNGNIPSADVPVSEGTLSKPIEATVKSIDTASIISIVWLCVFAALIIYGIISCILLYKRTAVSMRKEDNIYICDDIKGAFIFGIFKPKIYLPSILEPTQRDYVIDHERAHLKRLDHIWKLVAFVIASIHWFNPFVWLAYIFFCRDTELACDEKVVSNYSIADKKFYSLALLNCSVPHRKLIATPLAFGEIGVKARIKSTLHYKKPAFWVIVIAVALCAAAAAMLMTNPTDKKQPPASEETQEISADTEEIPETDDTEEIPKEPYVELTYPQGKRVEEKIAGLPTYDIAMYADEEYPIRALITENGLRTWTGVDRIALIDSNIPDFAIIAELPGGSGQISWWIKNVYYKNTEFESIGYAFILGSEIIYDGQCVYICPYPDDSQEEILAVGPNTYTIIGDANTDPEIQPTVNMLPQRPQYSIDIENNIVKYTAYHTLIQPENAEDTDIVLQVVHNYTNSEKDAFETVYSTCGHIEYKDGQWILVEEGQTTVGALFSDEYLINYMKEHPYGDSYVEYLIEQRNINSEETE